MPKVLQFEATFAKYCHGCHVFPPSTDFSRTHRFARGEIAYLIII
jgi:hypothetical protein